MSTRLRTATSRLCRASLWSTLSISAVLLVSGCAGGSGGGSEEAGSVGDNTESAAAPAVTEAQQPSADAPTNTASETECANLAKSEQDWAVAYGSLALVKDSTSADASDLESSWDLVADNLGGPGVLPEAVKGMRLLERYQADPSAPTTPKGVPPLATVFDRYEAVAVAVQKGFAGDKAGAIQGVQAVLKDETQESLLNDIMAIGLAKTKSGCQ
jgi:hypothetical protein